jgi:hypothetical protein
MAALFSMLGANILRVHLQNSPVDRSPHHAKRKRGGSGCGSGGGVSKAGVGESATLTKKDQSAASILMSLRGS